MENLQEKLVSLSTYGATFEVSKGNFIVRVKYKDDWTIIQPSDDVVKMYKDEHDANLYYYVTPITTDIALLFECIDDTIGYNKEMEEKVEYFKEKLGELRELFASESLDTLKTLEFKVKRRKVKAVQKKEEPVVEKEPITEYAEPEPITEEVVEDTPNGEKTPQEENLKVNEVLEDKIEQAMKRKNNGKKLRK